MTQKRLQGRNNSSDNVFVELLVGPQEPLLFAQFLDSHDFSANTRRAMIQDVRKFASWFAEANDEPFVVGRVTTRDITDCKNYLRRERVQAVNTVNRTLVTIRRFFGWLCEKGTIESNPAKPVKELRRVELAPKGLHRSDVRRLLREIELRQDVRACAVFSTFLYTGCRISDLVYLELGDLVISERSGSVVFRHGKGNKQRSVPLPLPARKALQAYLETRPPVESDALFIGERGPLTEKGVRSLFDKYSTITGLSIHPHLMRHTFSHRYLEANAGDLVGLAQILGHSNLNTTARYTKKTTDQLSEACGRLDY